MNGEPATCDGEHTTGLNARYVGTTSDGQHGENAVGPGCGKTRTRDEDGDTGESR